MNIKVKELSKIYGSGENRIVALDRVNMEIGANDFISIMGPSGSGKSTLLHLLSGLDKPTSGSLTYDGKEIYSYHDKELSAFRRQRIGFVFQQFNLYPHMSVLKNLTLAPMKLHHKSRAEAEELAYHYLDVVGLREKAHVYPTTLSGGQQQRIAIARALCMQSKIILFDEPTSALDPETIQEVLDVMIKLAKENITMVVVTHEMGFARQVADRVVFMADGQILEEGTPDEFFENPQNERLKTFLGKIIRK